MFGSMHPPFFVTLGVLKLFGALLGGVLGRFWRVFEGLVGSWVLLGRSCGHVGGLLRPT